ncbi:DnaJ domain-containing protein [Pseudomonas sp. W4I3]|uniref:DnaJ domain-containing protein n=1 Tax=Pseudomonas sp. W4I3 TaxID=3042294 RepID=UPI00277D41D5|nr:DnaJ domain-containing protein [Pseudomonas sp. W4I3]MDQ0739277.1 regulator of replication initiation timing [Pseudomonas sp. W4I3]
MFARSYLHTLIRKEEIILAIPKGAYSFISDELNALYDQGFIACSEIWAPTPLRAVEIFKENEKLEINRLRQEITRLQKACDELYSENEGLRRNSSHAQNSNSSVRNYEIFGFANTPQPEELKKRYRSLRQRVHPDKGGDTQLFQLIQKAFEQLTKN